jgi:hypothetical protein
MYSLNFTCSIFLSRTPHEDVRGRCVGGLYPLSFHGVNQLPLALLAA